jgi:hypothetical protein
MGVSGETPFGGAAYDFALRPDEEDQEEEEADGIEMEARGAAAGAGGRRAYRQTFQPLVAQELWWMGASAGTVLVLTAAACVLMTVG